MTKEKIMKIIENTDAYDLAAAYSEYVREELSDPDSELFAIEDMNEILYGVDLTRLADMLFYGDYSPSADFFTFDGYGNIESVHASDVVDFITCRLDDEELAELVNLL